MLFINQGQQTKICHGCQINEAFLFLYLTTSSVRLLAIAPQRTSWHSSGLCVGFPLILMSPIDLRTAHPTHPLFQHHIMHSEINSRQQWKVASQKFELKKREEAKMKKWGSLSCGALPLKASWPAICADSPAIATTPGRARERGKDGRKEWKTDGEHEWGMSCWGIEKCINGCKKNSWKSSYII